MKNILALIIMSFIFLGNGGLSEHVLTDLKDVVLYCNTKDFVKTMVKESYHMHLAADGLVPDEKHKHLYKMQLWMNPKNDHWAIIFVYKDMDKSCIVGGSKLTLHTP